jgi:hypothetical protein
VVLVMVRLYALKVAWMTNRHKVPSVLCTFLVLLVSFINRSLRAYGCKRSSWVLSGLVCIAQWQTALCCVPRSYDSQESFINLFAITYLSLLSIQYIHSFDPYYTVPGTFKTALPFITRLVFALLLFDRCRSLGFHFV